MTDQPKRLAIRLRKDTDRQIADLSEALGIAPSTLIDRIIREYLRSH